MTATIPVLTETKRMTNGNLIRGHHSWAEELSGSVGTAAAKNGKCILL